MPQSRGDGGLDEVAEVVELVPPGEVLHGFLGSPGPGSRSSGSRPSACTRSSSPTTSSKNSRAPAGASSRPISYAEPFERLVQVRVEERVAPAVRRSVRHEEAPQVVHVAGGAQLLDGVRDGGGLLRTCH